MKQIIFNWSRIGSIVTQNGKMEKTHRGDLMRSLMIKSGKGVHKVSAEMGIGNATLYRWLDNPDMPYNQMKRIADVLRYDLREAFPETASLYDPNVSVVLEGGEDYKLKYYQLIEKHSEVQDDLIKCKNIITDL